METEGCETRSWSLPGAYLKALGIAGFFQSLSAQTDGAIIDSRVLFRHLGLSPSRRDRFLSDLLKPQEITDPAVRSFTETAVDSSIPIVLGGHTLVSGGLYALAESAWQRTDRSVSRDREKIPAGEWIISERGALP